MIRILIFLLSILLLTGAITVLTTFDDRITGEAFGHRFDGPTGFILGLIGFAFLAAIYLTHKVKDILAMPAKIRRKNADARRERGVAALTRGLEAVAVGDSADAAHHARVAQRHLDETALTRLLSAQAAHLSGDDAGASQSYRAMLEAPETEFLGLRGLYMQAQANGETALAQQYAERAFSLRPNAGWAFQSVLDMAIDRGDWGDARAAIDKGKRNSLIDQPRRERALAALLTADAFQAHDTGDKGTARKELEAALKLAPQLTPAAVLAAQLFKEDGKIGRAAKIIEAAFERDAHPALIDAYEELYETSEASARSTNLNRLAAKNPEAFEATLLKGRSLMEAGSYQEAVDTLEAVLVERPTARVYSLVAKAIEGRDGADAARGWYAKAASAPRDPRPGADGVFQFTKEGWARLIREFMDNNRLAHDPLEVAPPSLEREEVRVLIAPPVIEEPVDVEEVTEQSVDEPPEEVVSDETEPTSDEASADDVEMETAASGTDEPVNDEPVEEEQSDEDRAEEVERAANGARLIS